MKVANIIDSMLGTGGGQGVEWSGVEVANAVDAAQFKSQMVYQSIKRGH